MSENEKVGKGEKTGHRPLGTSCFADVFGFRHILVLTGVTSASGKACPNQWVVRNLI
jgi:hypothetical protein